MAILKGEEEKETHKSEGSTWKLHTDCTSSTEGAGAGLVLTDPLGIEHTYAL
jgi:hypothetical protein